MTSPVPVVAVTCRDFAVDDDRPLGLLARAGFAVRVNTTGRRLSADEIVEIAADAVGIVAGTEPFREDLLARLGTLRVLSRCGTGVDNVDVGAASRRGIPILRTPDGPAPAVAELALAMILGLARRLPLHDRLVRSGRWEARSGDLLEERTLAIVGLGRIGRRLAEIARPLFRRIVAVEPVPDLPTCERLAVELLSLDEALAAADVVSLHLPSAPETRGLFDAARLARMKRGAYLVNTARGELVDEAALLAAIESGRLAGAALDVFAEEPYRGPLLERPEVIVTPHVGSRTVETRRRMELEAVENLIRTLALP